MSFDRDRWIRAHGPDLLQRMWLIREFESRLQGYMKDGLILGSTHPSVGMEAIAVGVSGALGPQDLIASTHRGHGHVLARGGDPERLLAEIFGRATGYCGGKGGSMHVGDRELGILGTNGIVGASIGIATGAALASRLGVRQGIAVAYFGDGAMNQGIFHEALNLASIWSLPCVYVCENNHFAQSAAIHDMVNISDLARRADAYGMPGVAVDGMDVAAVYEQAAAAVTRARDGNGPTLIVADTWRFLGHMVGDTEIYRSAEDNDSWRGRDPITQLEESMTKLGHPPPELDAIAEEARQAVEAAEAAARSAPWPDLETAQRNVYASESYA